MLNLLSCLANICCIKPDPKIENDKNKIWSQLTIKNNIRAIPFSENSEELSKLKQTTAYYFKGLTENPNSDPVWQEKSLCLLNQLDNLIDTRIKEVAYLNIAHDINRFKWIITVNDSHKFIQTLEQTREKLNTCEQHLIKLKRKINIYTQFSFSCKNRIQLLNKVCSEAINKRKTLYTTNINNNEQLALKEIKKDLNWSIEKIQLKQQNIPEMDLDQLSRLIIKIRQQQTSCQKDLVSVTEKLRYTYQYNNLQTRNIKLLNEIELKLSKKIEDSNSLFAPKPQEGNSFELTEAYVSLPEENENVSSS